MNPHNSLSYLLLQLVLGFSLVASSFAYPMPQMRICIRSADPSRLPNQCIYCKSRLFPLTVRLCTGNTYLPASMTLNEAACLAATCRKQLPRLPPEPYVGLSPSNSGASQSAPGNGGNGNEDIHYSTNTLDPAANGEDNFEETESLMAQQSTKLRQPAKFFLGKPHKVQNSSELARNMLSLPLIAFRLVRPLFLG